MITKLVWGLGGFTEERVVEARGLVARKILLHADDEL